MELSLFKASSPDWSRQVTQNIDLLPKEDHSLLFPRHFLQVTLPRIGGYLLVCRQENDLAGIGFLFPRAYASRPDDMRATSNSRQRAYTLRYHPHTGSAATIQHLERITEHLTYHLPHTRIVPYDPAAEHTYEATQLFEGDVSIGRPGRQESLKIRQLQAEIWGSPSEFLYPSDIHSTEFQPGASLVARVNNVPAGFLFGFYSYGEDPLPYDWHARFGGDLRLESQAMGVLPQYRGMRIGNLLKKTQADQAWQENIGIVHWTADPLQYANAALNFGLLRAIAYEFHPNYYPFRNELNRVPASRLGITWLVGSERVQEVPHVGSKASILEIERHPSVRKVNDGLNQPIFDAQDSIIAIEIPARWTELQRSDIELALRWRATTDQIFSSYVGSTEGKYVITGVGTGQEGFFLIAERVDDQLWNRLGSA